MREFKLIRNESGMSLVEVMLASTLLIGVLLGFTKMIQNSNKSIKVAEKNLDTLSLLSEFKVTLSAPASCANSFRGLNAKASTGIPELKNSADVVFASANSPYGTTQIVLSEINISDSASDVGALTVAGIGTTHLELVFDRGSKSGGVQFITKKIRLRLTTDAVGDILTCVAFSGGLENIWKNSTANVDDIFYQDGNVAIGIDAPEEKLHVEGVIKAKNLRMEWKATDTSMDGYVIDDQENILLNPTTAAYNLSLPDVPKDGDVLNFLHAAGDLTVMPVSIFPGADDTIGGELVLIPLIFDINHLSIGLYFYDPNDDGNGDWRIF